MSRGQAALEFLSTYGWMVMVLLITGAALAYFGVFDFNRYTSQRCDMGLEFSCENFRVQSDGIVRVKLKNLFGEPVAVSDFSCQYNDDDTDDSAVPAGLWPAGEVFDFQCDGPDLPERDKVIIKLLMHFTVDEGFTKSAYGTVTANVVSS